MKSINKYFLLTSSAMILARVASAALEVDAKENKALTNKVEFNKKISELNPPSLVIPPFSSAKDYKRLAGVCFLGIGDCDRNVAYGKGDDYTKPCEIINPCSGFTATSGASCTEGFTTCETGCQTKYKCNPPSYTQSCSYPYRGVGAELNGKYKSCECLPEFQYGTNNCPAPQIPNTASASCEGKYTSCTCPSSYSEACPAPFEGVGDTCNGKYKSCQCPATYNLTCEGKVGVGEACNGLYAECSDIPCADRGYTQTCGGVQQGVGEACDGKYKSCQCRSDLVACASPKIGVGESCGGLFASCKCSPGLVTCTSPQVGIGTACDGKYSSCTCDSSYNKSCSATEVTGSGESCNGLYQSCECRSDLVSCSGNMVGVGSSCGGLYITCSCPSSYNKSCSSNQTCSGSTCGGMCNGTCVTNSSGGSTGGGGGGGGWVGSSSCPSFVWGC